MPNKINRSGQRVPVLAFYSVSGGVGKSTLARKFAELVTRATDPAGHNPNVLLVDLDVDSMGLTYRIMGGKVAGGTTHETIAARNPNVANAHNVTANVSIAAAGNRRGQLYLLPGAPADETRTFEVIRATDPPVIMDILSQAIDRLVQVYAISCVVIDCAPGGQSYSAAAAAIADVPVLVGRNEETTYKQINVLPQKFREMCPEFQPVAQKVVINAVAVREFYEKRARDYALDDWIPLVSEIIHETEGVASRETLRMLLFENYVIDLIKKFLIGHDHLIPKANDVLPDEWLEMFRKLDDIDKAPKMKRLRRAAKLLLPVGGVALIAGIAALLLNDSRLFSAYTESVKSGGMVLSLLGVASTGMGIFGSVESARLARLAREIAMGGADRVAELVKGQASHRRKLDEIKRLADTIPRH